MPLKKRARGRRKAAIETGLVTMVGLLATTAPAAAEVPLLAQGASGPAVSQVQGALHIAVTGRFGSATRHAVLAFQRGDRLEVDGIVGPQTWDTLFGVVPQPAAGTTARTSTSTTATGSATTESSTSGGYAIPPGIVSCESGGNYSAVNPSSGAGGAYQILPSTWHAYGGEGLPQDAPPAEQDHVAAAIYANRGSSAWSC